MYKRGTLGYKLNYVKLILYNLKPIDVPLLRISQQKMNSDYGKIVLQSQ